MKKSNGKLLRELLAALIQCRQCINHFGIVGDPASGMADEAIEHAEKALAKQPAIDPRVLANKRETFGEVSWCDDDIREALRETKRPITPANIEAVRDSWYARHISDTMIESGWENLYTAARELPEKAKRKA